LSADSIALHGLKPTDIRERIAPGDQHRTKKNVARDRAQNMLCKGLADDGWIIYVRVEDGEIVPHLLFSWPHATICGARTSPHHHLGTIGAGAELCRWSEGVCIPMVRNRPPGW